MDTWNIKPHHVLLSRSTRKWCKCNRDMSRSTLLDVVGQETTFVDAMSGGLATIEGDAGALITVFGNLDKFSMGFAIVEP